MSNEIGKALQGLRTKAGLSVPKLATKAGLSSQTVYLIESGAAPGKLETLAAVAKALGCDVHLALMNGKNVVLAIDKAGGREK